MITSALASELHFHRAPLPPNECCSRQALLDCALRAHRWMCLQLN